MLSHMCECSHGLIRCFKIVNSEVLQTKILDVGKKIKLKKLIQHNQPRGKKSNLRAESEANFPGDFTNIFFKV